MSARHQREPFTVEDGVLYARLELLTSDVLASLSRALEPIETVADRRQLEVS